MPTYRTHRESIVRRACHRGSADTGVGVEEAGEDNFGRLEFSSATFAFVLSAAPTSLLPPVPLAQVASVALVMPGVRASAIGYQ